MKKELVLKLSPKEAFDEILFDKVVREKVKGDLFYQIRRRSVDARGAKVVVNVWLEVGDRESISTIQYQLPDINVNGAKRVIIIGAGPAGLFAALQLIEMGVKPVILERGKDVRTRRRDIAAINKEHIVHSDSNYCFGEGGAGTYSDGKLYTRSKKRGSVRRILEILVAHGAKQDILYDAHPHIGTNKLPKIIASIRQSILDHSGEIHFNTRVTDLLIEKDKIKGVLNAQGDAIMGEAVIMATGHSARDIYMLLQAKRIAIEAKPFALGVRVEHAQALIDQIQYHCNVRDAYLPAASYTLVHQSYYKKQKRGVFSFCMCPGGFIVPAATSPGEVVVNGMSPSRRDSLYANSGIVVAIEMDDLGDYLHHDALAGMYFQQEIEQKACSMAGGKQTAPAQRMVDFIEHRVSSSLLSTSYQPGLLSVDLNDVLPDFISERLRNAFKVFGKKMRGYLTNEAQLVGVESRTSSPVQIPRERDSLEHIQIKGLFPCGEGAGYAGGIVSAAMDGEKCAEQAVRMYC